MQIPNSEYWLDLVREKKGINSDYKLADTLALTRARLSQIRKGAGQFGPAAAVRAAHILEVDPLLVVASVLFHGAGDGVQEDFWRAVYLERLGKGGGLKKGYGHRSATKTA